MHQMGTSWLIFGIFTISVFVAIIIYFSWSTSKLIEEEGRGEEKKDNGEVI